MSDEPRDDEQVGAIQVRISPKAVHKAVRNILVNEFGLSREAVQAELKAQIAEVTEKVIRDQTLAYIKETRWDKPGVETRAKLALDHQINDLKTIIKEVVAEQTRKHIRDEVEGVVAAVIRDGFKVKIGWNREVAVKVEEAS